MSHGTDLINYILRATKNDHQRSGQLLFNNLPPAAGNAVAGTLFDPFHKELDAYELTDWVQQHLIFDSDGQVMGVFNGNQLIWERDKPLVGEHMD